MIKSGAVVKVLMLIALLVIVIPTAFAQDADLDGIKDGFDACPDTVEGLPLIKLHTEYLGCSCLQISESLGDNLYCLDFYCFEDRQLSTVERSVTANAVKCDEDYCIGNDLYDFPEPGVLSCINGELPPDHCKLTITKGSSQCLFGLVGQKKVEVPPPEVTILEEEIEPKERIDLIYDVVLENNDIKEFLGNPNREEFQRSILLVERKVNVNKEFTNKKIGDTGVTIPYVTITIIPKPNKELENLAVFEVIKNPEFERNDLVAFGKEPFIVTDDGLAVWIYEKVGKEGVVINYQINEQLVLDTETFLVAKVRGRFFLADLWPLLLIPLIGYLAYRYVMSSKK